jgi:predicted DNA-binding protein with PD1-like motif
MRAGRRRKADRSRKPATNIIPDQVLQRKADLIGGRYSKKGTKIKFYRQDGKTVNGILLEYPLGILLARGVITKSEHDAGIEFAKLRVKAGISEGQTIQCHLASMLPRNVAGDEIQDEKLERAMRRFKAAYQAIPRMSRKITLNVVCFGEHPDYLYRHPFSQQGDAIKQGLKALEKEFSR